MKYAYFILAAALIALSSCSSTYQARNDGADDVYYSPGTAPAEVPVTSGQTGTQSSPSDYTPANQPSGERFQYSDQEQYSDEKGNTYITNNYYIDDYYDYSYSSRIRRFHRPAGFGYYSSYYTNSYWYDYYPPSYGISIYVGYNWWPSPGCIRYPFYYGYYCPRPYYYGYYYNPGYYWHSYNYGYWHGYNHGYWHGYHAGLYGGYYSQPYYFNSYDQTSYYYGPRGSTGSNNATIPPTLATTFTSAVEKGEVPINPRGHYDLSADQVKNNVSKQDPKNNIYTQPSVGKTESVSPVFNPGTKTDDYAPAVRPGSKDQTDQVKPAVPREEPVKSQPDVRPTVPQQQPVRQEPTDSRPPNIKNEPAPSDYTSPAPAPSNDAKPQQAQPSKRGDQQAQPQQQSPSQEPTQPSRGTQQSAPAQTQPTDRGNQQTAPTQTQPSDRGTQQQQRPSNRYQQGPSPQQYSAPMEERYNKNRPDVGVPAQPQTKPQQKYQPKAQPRQQQKADPAPKNKNNSSGNSYERSQPSESSQPSKSTSPSNRSGSSNHSNPARGR
jgi:hypothetical protein